MKEQKQIDESLMDLIEIIHFTENISAKIHGLLDEAEIYKTIREETSKSNLYDMSILLLTEDGSELKIAEASMSSQRLRAAEKVTGLEFEGYRIKLKESSFYKRAAIEGQTVQVHADDIMYELFPKSLANLILRITNYRERSTILTPLTQKGRIAGVLAISSTKLAEYFIPSVKSLAQHISAALELSHEYTERRKIEEELLKSEEKFRTLTENVNVGVYRNTPGPKGKFIEANPAIIKMFGYETREEFLSLNVSDLYQNPEDRKKFNKKMSENGFVRNEELLLKKKEGTSFVGSVSAVAIKDERGEIRHYDGIIEDITKRKEMEEILRRSEEKYRTILENIEDGYFEVDIAGNLTFFNDSLCRILGYPREELMGMNNREYMSERTAEAVYQTFNMVFRTGGPTRAFDWEVIKKDRSIGFVETSISLIVDPSGQPIGFRGIVRDITERKEAEKKLMESEEKYRILVDHSLQGIVVTQDYRIVFANPAFAKILGYETEELLSMTPEQVKATVYPEDQSLVWERYQRRLEGKSAPPRYEFRIIRKDGTIRWLEQLATCIRYHDKPAVQTSVIDITERKEAEEQMKTFSQKLERKIEERSARIEVLLSTRQELQKEQSWEKGLRIIVESMSKLRFDRAGVFLIDPSRKRLVFHLGKGVELPRIGSSISLREKEYYGVKCVMEKKTIHVKDAGSTEGKQMEPESRSFAWIPIVVQDEAFAALAAGNIDDDNPVTDENVKDLEILASMCGAFIDRTRMFVEPSPEKQLATKAEYWLDPSEGYIVSEKKPERTLEIFRDLVTHGIPGFIISRQYPEKTKRKYKLLKTPMIWLSRSEARDTVSPDDLSKISYIVEDFIKKCEESAILLDGVEYLITQTDFETVIRYLQKLKDLVVLNNSRLIIPFHKDTVSRREYSILEREFKVL